MFKNKNIKNKKFWTQINQGSPWIVKSWSPPNAPDLIHATAQTPGGAIDFA